ncbi:MAG TPA: lipoyl(octanoyl) transferase LipB [Candidatus Dormibacteraeota bacterium]|nr:lipoyl(octanoyl) transferase LipB [Candidatus Dormibacteraeota bacterium]
MSAVASRLEPVVATLQVRRLGCRPYDEVLALQESLLAAVADGAPETLLLLEHPPVYTLGRGADAADLRGAPERLRVPCFRVGRGGGATFHGPGQLVAYPIVRLRAAGRDVHGYVRALEQALIDGCAAFGVAASTPSGETGVWVGERKIGSIGIGVRHGVAYHGIALNVTTDLGYFDAITVCRSDGLRLVNLAELCSPAPDLDAVGAAFAPALAARLGRELAEVAWR